MKARCFKIRNRNSSHSLAYASIYDEDNPTEATNFSDKLLGDKIDRYEPAMIREYCSGLSQCIYSCGDSRVCASRSVDMETLLDVDLEDIFPLDRSVCRLCLSHVKRSDRF